MSSPIIVINATTKDGKQIRASRRPSSTPTPGPDDRTKNVHVVGGGKKQDAIQDEQYDGRYRTSQHAARHGGDRHRPADGFKAASRKLTLPEGKTEEVTFVLEPK